MTTLLFLPSGQTDWRWMRIEGARLVEEGEGLPPADAETIAIVPADAVTLHWADLPARSIAQATAAARILAGDASASPIGELHVAVGDEGPGERPIAVVGVAAMRDWLRVLGEAGVDPQAIVPAPMIVPRPDDGYARAELAGQGVVRGRNSGFAAETRLTELVTGGIAPATVSRGALEMAIVAMAAAPTLDLRQGPFARRRRFVLDWRLIRRLAALSVAILLVTLAISLVRIAKYSFGADALETRADTLARTGLPRSETVTDSDRQLDDRLSRVRGPGLGFTSTAAAVFAAVRTVPGSEVTGLDFQTNGDIRLTIAVEREALATDLKRAIESAGFAVRAGVFEAKAGRVTGEMTVSGA